MSDRGASPGPGASSLRVRSPGFTFTHFQHRLSSAGKIHSGLLDKARLGDVLRAHADESLFHAGLHPAREAASLTTADEMALYYSLRYVVSRAGGGYGSQVRHALENGGPAAERARSSAFGRAGEPCSRCGSMILRTTVDGGTAFFCPRDQPLASADRTPSPVPLALTEQLLSDRHTSGSQIFVLIGPPSAGKTTLARRIASMVPLTRLVPIVKARERRLGEIDGVDAFHVSREEFDRLKRNDAFDLLGEYLTTPYGVPWRLLTQAFLEGRDAIIILPPGDGDRMKRLYPNVYVIHLFPSSIEILKERITARPDYPTEMRQRRAEVVERWASLLGLYDVTIITDTHEQTLHDAFDVVYRIRCYGSASPPA